MRFGRKAKVVTGIPTASMADISFLLLVFFMVSTVFVRYRGIPVELPDAEKIEKLENRRMVTHIWVGSQGAISIDDQLVPLNQVGKLIHGKMSAMPNLIISIKADEEAEFGLVSDVMQELRKVEALRVNFATDRERNQ